MKKSTLYMDLKVGQSLSIDGGRVTITLEEKSGQRAKLKFVNDEDVNITRPASPAMKSGAAQARMGIK